MTSIKRNFILCIHAFSRVGYLIAYYFVNCVVGYSLAEIGKNTKVHPTVIIRNPQNVRIGDNCYFNHNVILNGGHESGKLRIGSNVLVGPNVCVYVANHRFDDPGTAINRQGYREKDVVIGNDVWIGANSVIVPGSELGDGCVVAAGAVVTRKFPPNSILGGIPAKIITTRGG